MKIDEWIVFSAVMIILFFTSAIALFPSFFNQPITGSAVLADEVPLKFSVNAVGTLYQNEEPRMELWTRESSGNGWKRLSSWVVDTKEYRKYSFVGKMPPGEYEFAVVFVNDAKNEREDRDLFVDGFIINGKSFLINSGAYVFDQGIGRDALDGKQTFPNSNGNLYRNGALRGIIVRL